jgi:D-glycero-D-manno-heptose 1,7-bisphosphate phosphatase
MLRQIAERFGVEPPAITVIGDSLSDLQAAIAIGARVMLVRTGKGKATERDIDTLPGNIEIIDYLAHAVSALLVED